MQPHDCPGWPCTIFDQQLVQVGRKIAPRLLEKHSFRRANFSASQTSHLRKLGLQGAEQIHTRRSSEQADQWWYG